jgi:hypothetical protein
VEPPAVQEALFEVELRPERRYYRQIMRALAGVLLDEDPLRAEVAVSRVLGVIWTSDPARDGGAEEAFGRGLVEYARQHSQPVAANLLRVLCATATVREVREAAAEALAVRSWPAAHWDPAVGDVQVARCWVVEDAFGDHATVLCEFWYGAVPRGGPRHGIAVHVDRVAQGVAVDVTLVDDVDAAELELRLGADHASDEFRRVEPGWAGAVLQQALARTDLLPATPVAPGFAPLRALALARLRALPVTTLEVVNGPAMYAPDPSPGHREAIVAEFAHSPEASALAAVEPGVVTRLAGLLVEFAARIDPADLLRVSPGRIEAFLFDWLPAALRSGETELRSGETDLRSGEAAPTASVAAVVRAWTAWAARQGGTPLLTRDALARAVEEILTEYRSSR